MRSRSRSRPPVRTCRERRAVLLTVVDPSGATSQATATVTVVDQTPPAISCPAPITVSTSPGACSAPVVFATTASDICSPPVDGHLDACSRGRSSRPGSRPSRRPRGMPPATPLPARSWSPWWTTKRRPSRSCGCTSASPGGSTTTTTIVRARCPGKNGKDRRAGRDHGNNRDDRVIDVTLNYDILDNCGASCVLSVHGPRRRNRNDTGVARLDHRRRRTTCGSSWTTIAMRRTSGIRSELTCTDAAGNRKVETATVLIPDRR